MKINAFEKAYGELELHYLEAYAPAEKDFYATDGEVPWITNCVPNDISSFDGLNVPVIEDYYSKDPYARVTRLLFWKECVRVLKRHNIQTVLDIGAGNGHFVSLCLEAGINAYGLEPRSGVVSKMSMAFWPTKRLYRSTLKSFYEYDGTLPRVDCITVLNFFHAHRDVNEVRTFLEVLPKVTDHLLTSVPDWKALGTDNLFKGCGLVAPDIYTKEILAVEPEFNCSHNLYRIPR